ncbi:MAG: hypothetical protein ACKVZ0_23410 [Gemmatimonadales bacterium]
MDGSAARPRLLVALAGGLLVCAPTPLAQGAAACLAAAPTAGFALPTWLREVSGLALSGDGRLWLHNDERGLVGAIDPANGASLGTFQLGPNLLRGDLEGITVAGDRLFVITTTGQLIAAPVPARTVPSGVLTIEVIDTGLRPQCEIEGLAFEPAGRILLIACKQPLVPALAKQVTIFRWSIDANRLATPDRITIAEAALAPAGGRKARGFHPSAIERHPVTGQYWLLASADQAFAVVDGAGRVLETGRLAKRHRQPEGLAIAPNGHLLISDEGAKGPGTITTYACR